MWKNGSSLAPNRLRARRTPLAIADSRPYPGVYRCRTRSASPYRIERSTIASVLSDPGIVPPELYLMKRCSPSPCTPRSLSVLPKGQGSPRQARHRYEEINLARDPDGRAELVERTGMFTFPQILIGDETIGGFNELVAADRAGRLSELLAA